MNEVTAAIAKLKKGKAPEVYVVLELNARRWRKGCSRMVSHHLKLDGMKGEVWADCKKAVIVPIHKKGRVYTRIVDVRVRSYT